MSSNTNPVIGDIAEYTITVENKGNVDVSNLNLNDTFVGLAGASIQLNGGPTFQSATAGSNATTVKRDGIVTYTASFTVNQASVDSGGFRNTVVVTGSNPGSSSADVIEASDDGIDDDGNLTNDPTDVVIGEVPQIEVTKTATFTDNDSSGAISLGDRINYTILVQNLSNVTLDNISVSDDLQDINLTVTKTLDTGPSFVSSNQGSAFGTLKPNEIATFQGTYIIRQVDVDAGGLSNQASVTAQTPSDATITDASDDGNDFDQNTVDDRTETIIPRIPGIEVKNFHYN